MRRSLALLFMLAACGGAAEEPLPPFEPQPEPEPEACDLVPIVTWENFGDGFVTTYCQGCHASTALDRQGAPLEVTFDSEEQTLVWAGVIRAVAASEEPSMPPGGGPLDEDRDRLAIWLDCFAE